MRHLLLIVLAVLLSACPGPGQCGQAFVGDPNLPIEAQPFVLDVSADETQVLRSALKDGDAAPLIIPQQGGFVVYAGLGLRNLDRCNVTLAAEFLDDMQTTALSGLDTRKTDLVATPTPDGFYLPRDLESLSTVPNIPLCPNFLGKNLANVPAVLELLVTDQGGRSARFTRRVAPSCLHPDTQAFCLCTCGANYQPGKCSMTGPVDQGVGG